MTLNLLVTLFAALASIAQNAVPRLPAGVEATLSVRIVDHRSTFYMGEVIPLELEFHGQASAAYYFSTENYDRSGRVESDTYVVAPADAVRDPLADLHRAGMGAIGGGIRGIHAIDGRPFRHRVSLNEWMTFTRPGRYELTVSSARLHRHREGPAGMLRSNIVAFEIQPAPPQWADAQLARATALIRSGSADGIRQGVTTLRHLGTRDAALTVVALHETLPREARFDVLACLVGSPFRADVVSAMEARLDRGEAVPAEFVRDVSLLRSLLETTPLWLIAMYGSSELAPLVRDVLRVALPCAAEAAALAFLLKHDLQSALDRLDPSFDRAHTCRQPPFAQIAMHYWDGRLEDAAVVHMQDDDPRRASEAIRVLGRYGSVGVSKEAMLRRLETLAIEWRGRADELQASPFIAANGIEGALLNARSGIRGWV